jgi:hypothetical protein
MFSRLLSATNAGNALAPVESSKTFLKINPATITPDCHFFSRNSDEVSHVGEYV